MAAKRGNVVYFDLITCRGVIRAGEENIPFHSTSFSSGSPTRFPQSGEIVEVVMDDEGKVLTVRSIPS